MGYRLIIVFSQYYLLITSIINESKSQIRTIKETNYKSEFRNKKKWSDLSIDYKPAILDSSVLRNFIICVNFRHFPHKQFTEHIFTLLSWRIYTKLLTKKNIKYGIKRIYKSKSGIVIKFLHSTDSKICLLFNRLSDRNLERELRARSVD